MGKLLVLLVLLILFLSFMGILIWTITTNGIAVTVRHEVILNLDDDLSEFLNNTKLNKTEIQNIIEKEVKRWETKQ